MKQKYYANLSFLRAFACIAIVLLHTVNSAAILYESRISRSVYAGSMAVVEALSWAVPCFLMVTGALLLDPAREISLKKLFSKYILRVVIALAAAVLLFRAFDMLLNGEVLTASAVGRGFLNILTGKSWSHLWYLYVLIGLYLLLPLFRAAAEKLSVATLWYLVLVLFVFVSLLPLLELLDLSVGFSIPVSSIYPLYLFAGYLIFKKPLPKALAILLVLVGAGGLAAAAYLCYDKGLSFLNVLLNYASPLTALLSCGVFSLFASIPADSGEKNFFTRALCALDRASFGIYLIHLIFIRLILRYWGVDPYAIGIWSFAAVCLAALAVSWLIVWILCLIPGVGTVLGAASHFVLKAREEGKNDTSHHRISTTMIYLLIVLAVSAAVFSLTYGFLRHPGHFAFEPVTHETEAESSQTVSETPQQSEISEPESADESSQEASQESSREIPPEASAPESSEVSTDDESSAAETPAYQGVSKEKVREENPQAAAVLDEVGWDLQEAFNWVAKFPWARMSVDYSMGAEWFKDFGYENRYGNCYVMAATFCDLAKALGYDARQMIGEVPMERGGFGKHSWVEINLSGGTYVFDPDYTSETGKSGFLLTYEQGNTWVYTNYEPML